MTAMHRSIVLAAELSSVRTGRHFARDVLTEWDLRQLVEDAQLGTSELVTNAVRHAGTELELSLLLSDAVTIEVRDREPELPHPDHVEFDPTAESGRGLQIVAAISDDWGVTARPDGKAVWFTLRLPDEGAADADVFSLANRRQDAGETAPGPEHAEQNGMMEQARGAN